MRIRIPFCPYRIEEEAELWNKDFDAVSKLLFLLFPEKKIKLKDLNDEELELTSLYSIIVAN